MEAKTKSVDMLKESPKNVVRTIKDEALDGLPVSVEEFGDLSGVVWNKRNGELVAGHKRMQVLRAAGATTWTEESPGWGVIVHPKTREEFAIRIVDWDETKHRLAMIAANNPLTQGEFVDVELEAELRELEAQVSFEALRLDDLLAEVQLDGPVDRERQSLEDFDVTPRPKRTWILIATDEARAPEIEALLRERFEDANTRIEVSVGAK